MWLLPVWQLSCLLKNGRKQAGFGKRILIEREKVQGVTENVARSVGRGSSPTVKEGSLAIAEPSLTVGLPQASEGAAGCDGKRCKVCGSGQ